MLQEVKKYGQLQSAASEVVAYALPKLDELPDEMIHEEEFDPSNWQIDRYYGNGDASDLSISLNEFDPLDFGSRPDFW
jgi:hypothetical protein